MLRIKNKLGQSTAEYAILIGVVIAAVIGMQSWVGRNIKGKIRDAAVNAQTLVPGYPVAFNTTQFEPGTTSHTETTRSGGGETTASTQFGGEITRTFSTETTNRTGNIVSPGM